MRKNLTAAVLAVAAGCAGFVLRKVEINTAMHGGVGLAEEWSVVTILLTVLTLAVIAFAVYFAAISYRGKEDTFEMRYDALSTKISIGAAAASAIGAALYAVGNFGLLSPIVLIFAALGLAGAAALYICCGEKAMENTIAKTICIAPPIFCCLWLMLIYKDYSSEPQIIKFVYPCIAAAALTMSYYYSSGYFYEKNRPMETAAFSFAAIYLAMTAAADSVHIWQALLFLGFGAGAAVNLISIRKKKRA